MNGGPVVLFLICVILVLSLVIVYQQYIFKRGIQETLRDMGDKLSEILDKDSDEKVMVFTDNKVLMHLSGQINRLLINRQRLRTDYRRQEQSIRKMLANISHDMKTPLTVILGYLEIMRIHHEDDDALEKTEGKAKQLMELINQFFTLAKLEAGDMDLEITSVNINELCRESVLGFYEILQQRDFTVDISIPDQQYFIWGNEEALVRVLNNLLSNAIRYGSSGNYIGLFLRAEQNYVYIDVADKGKGIEKQFVESVFDRLYTMEDSRSLKKQGSGLGLTIARNLARQMGGDILLESIPGEKTVFTVKLKKQPACERNL